MPSPTNPLLLNYHFDVHFHRRDLKSDHRFQSVHGLHAQILAEDLVGRKNATFDNVKLTRAYEPDSKLVAWCMDAINNNHGMRRDLLHGPDHAPTVGIAQGGG